MIIESLRIAYERGGETKDGEQSARRDERRQVAALLIASVAPHLHVRSDDALCKLLRHVRLDALAVDQVLAEETQRERRYSARRLHVMLVQESHVLRQPTNTKHK